MLKNTLNNRYTKILLIVLLLISINSLIYFAYSIEKKQEAKKSLPTKDTSTNNGTQQNKVKQEEMTKEKIQNESVNEDSSKITSDIVVIQTDKGPIKIKLFTKEAPNTTSNFTDLVKKGFYNGTVFHRVVENFVIQGGDPLGDGTGNYIDPDTGKPRLINLEINPNLKFDKPGRVGMARSGNPHSASCQFFIALQALPSLNPGGVDPYGYAVFGQVTDDTFEVVKKIAKDFKPAFPGSDRPAQPIRMSLVTLQ